MSMSNGRGRVYAHKNCLLHSPFLRKHIFGIYKQIKISRGVCIMWCDFRLILDECAWMLCDYAWYSYMWYSHRDLVVHVIFLQGPCVLGVRTCDILARTMCISCTCDIHTVTMCISCTCDIHTGTMCISCTCDFHTVTMCISCTCDIHTGTMCISCTCDIHTGTMCISCTCDIHTGTMCICNAFFHMESNQLILVCSLLCGLIANTIGSI